MAIKPGATGAWTLRGSWPFGHYLDPGFALEVQAIVGGPVADARSDWDAAVRVAQPHPKANCATCVNAGFLFLRRSARVEELLKRWEQRLYRQRETDHNQKCARARARVLNVWMVEWEACGQLRTRIPWRA